MSPLQIQERNPADLRASASNARTHTDKQIRQIAQSIRIDQGLPGILNLTIPGLDSEAVMLVLKDLVALSNGSACTSASYDQSHVLTAMGLSDDRIAGALRFSWCHLTEEPDWGEIAARLKSLR